MRKKIYVYIYILLLILFLFVSLFFKKLYFLKLIFFLIINFFYPGYLILKKNNILKNDLFNFLYGFVINFGIFAVLAQIAYIFTFSYNLFLILFFLINFTVVLFFSYYGETLDLKKTLKDSLKFEYIILAGVIILIFTQFYKNKITVDLMFSAGIANKMAAYHNIINVENSYIGILDYFYMNNSLNLFYALIKKILNIDCIKLFIYLTPIFNVLSIYYIFFFIAKLFNRRAAAFSICIYLIILLYYEKNILYSIIGTESAFAFFILGPALFYFILEYKIKNKNLLLFFSCIGLITVHLFSALQVILSIFFYYLFLMLYDETKKIRKNIQLLFIITAIIFIYQWFIKIRYFPDNYFKISSNYLFYLNPQIFILKLKYYFLPMMYSDFSNQNFRIYNIAALFFMPIVLFFINKNKARMYILSQFFYPAFLLFTPLLFMILFKRIPIDLLIRIPMAVPFFLIYALLLYLFLPKKIHKLILVFLLFLILNKIYNIPSCRNQKENYYINNTTKDYFKDKEAVLSVIEYLKQIKIPKVILAQKNFTSFIQAYTNHYLALVDDGHCSIFCTDQKERHGLLRFFNNQEIGKQEINLLKKFNVDYIITSAILKENNARIFILQKIINNYYIYKVNR